MLTLKDFNKNILTAFSLRGLSAFLIFLLHQQISIKLGSTGSGIFGVMASIQALSVVFSSLGYNESIVKYIAQSYANKDTYSTSLIIKTSRLKTYPLAIISTLFVFCYLYWTHSFLGLPIQISLIIFPSVYIEQNSAILRGVGFFQMSWILLGIITPSLMLVVLLVSNTLLSETINLYLIFNWLVMFLSFFLVKKKLL